MSVIYGLFDPRKPLLLWEVRYIGQTTVAPRIRLIHHVSDAKRGDRYIDRWVRSLVREGVRPVIQVLETVEDSERHVRERAWIAEGKRQGWRLTNATDGGGGTTGFKASDATKEKQRLAKLGKKQTEEAKRNAVEGLRLARLADPTIDIRRGEKMSQLYKEHPEILVDIGEKVKQYWIDHPEELVAKGEQHREYWIKFPEGLVKRGRAIAAGIAKRDKTPQHCGECGRGPFVGPIGLGQHQRTHGSRDGEP